MSVVGYYVTRCRGISYVICFRPSYEETVSGKSFSQHVRREEFLRLTERSLHRLRNITSLDRTFSVPVFVSEISYFFVLFCFGLPPTLDV